MEGPEAADSADNEYMAMDADKLSENDDTYENGDTLGFNLRQKGDSREQEPGPDSTGQKKEEPEKEKVGTLRPQPNIQNLNTARPPMRPQPDRYITLRRLPVNTNRKQEMIMASKIALLRYVSVCLGVLCILLSGGLIGLGIYYYRLSESNLYGAERIQQLLDEIKALNVKIDIMKTLSKSIYHISSNEEPACSAGKDLFILNYDALEEFNRSSFHLVNKVLNDGDWSIQFSWKCTSNS
ncbi:uncharacterized protein LOC108888961 [Lates calcarifer]|uniref:Uncharacterized protein LOC108888961 n=1 Tax=Lates calcarifer TaxID=8187 RepID=A0AAJ7PX17_LATCA|nr:uncharacterized protein LOC108888961 [Lates calcarifer]